MLNNQPSDIIYYIFSYLSIRDLLNYELCSKLSYQIVSEMQNLWYQHYNKYNKKASYQPQLHLSNYRPGCRFTRYSTKMKITKDQYNDLIHNIIVTNTIPTNCAIFCKRDDHYDLSIFKISPMNHYSDYRYLTLKALWQKSKLKWTKTKDNTLTKLKNDLRFIIDRINSLESEKERCQHMTTYFIGKYKPH